MHGVELSAEKDNVPDRRPKFGATYRPNKNWAYTIAARYRGKQYSTLDNTDIVPNVCVAFDNTFVVDIKVHYAATKNFSLDFGVDNVFNAQYFLFHPFPGRSYVVASRYTCCPAGPSSGAPGPGGQGGPVQGRKSARITRNSAENRRSRPSKRRFAAETLVF